MMYIIDSFYSFFSYFLAAVDSSISTDRKFIFSDWMSAMLNFQYSIGVLFDYPDKLLYDYVCIWLNLHGKKGEPVLNISSSVVHRITLRTMRFFKMHNFSTQYSVTHSPAYVGAHNITLQLF